MLNDRVVKATGVSVAALFVLFAANGKAFFDALLGVPALFSAWAAVLPLGGWSSLIALLVAVGAWAFALRWATYLHAGKVDPGAYLLADTIALAVGVTVTVLQAWGEPRGVLLSALWLGVGAGFLAPYIARCVGALYRAVRG